MMISFFSHEPVRSRRRRLRPCLAKHPALWDCAFRWHANCRYDDEQRLRKSPLHGQLQGKQLPPCRSTVGFCPDAVQHDLGLQSKGRSAIVSGERSQAVIAAISGSTEMLPSTAGTMRKASPWERLSTFGIFERYSWKPGIALPGCPATPPSIIWLGGVARLVVLICRSGCRVRTASLDPLRPDWKPHRPVFIWVHFGWLRRGGFHHPHRLAVESSRASTRPHCTQIPQSRTAIGTIAPPAPWPA